MIKGVFIGVGIVILAVLAVIFPGEVMSESDLSQYVLDKAYLEKNKESYALCYNSVNYGKSGLGSVEVELMGEYMNDPRITSETLKPIEEKFMRFIKQECSKPITDYEAAYKRIETLHAKSENLQTGWRTFVFGSGNELIPVNEILQYSPARARITLAFNDYVFTVDEAKSFYKEKLGL